MDYFEAGIFRPGEKEPPVKADAAREIITPMSHSNSDADALLLCTLARGNVISVNYAIFCKTSKEEVKLLTRLHKAMFDCPVLKVWHG